MKNINIKIIDCEGDQVEIDLNNVLDRPQFSICPKCDAQIIQLSEGCSACGWSENQFINDESSVESSISIPCTVKQPNQPEIQGVIKQDLGSRFLVYIPDSDTTVTVSKLFVYPDFSKLDKNPRKNIPASKNCSSKIIHPSKTRRQPGEGSGTIFYRTVTRNGRDYQEAYYKWRENGKQKTQYIPNKLLDKVAEAESRKLPVKDILVLLAGKGKCSRKKFDTEDKCSRKTIPASKDECSRKIIPASKKSENKCSRKKFDTEDECSRKIIPASKKRRGKGKGGGWIECKPIKLKGKEYKQYWYHYETWREGSRLVQSSKYIPKKMESKIIRMNNEKAPVEKILKVLESKSKRKR
ncbi:MAG: hypothetical protein QNJ55_20725 [Xenococcus sp. MO_188.B8]|nr:hypothetical protein [Xenococcus sp. MO_188.B8]